MTPVNTQILNISSIACYLNKAKLFLVTMCLCSQFSIAQTTNISGVVNTYHRVVEVIPAKACVRVSSTAGLNLYKKVLLIQMKGAGITTTNNASFGDTTALNNAGNYEVATICNIIGDSVFMFFSFLNSYTVTGGKVQLVQFGQYNNSALVTDTIKATAWNNTTGTGGVIALYVSDNLILNAPVYADAAGFQGGAFVLSNGICFNSPFDATGYVYNASNTSPQNGASKGENVYEMAAGETGGRGAPANGGGGGNNHNNSGGGGANLSGGGISGGNSSTNGCTSNLRGLPGKPLSSWGGKKIFFGGGGGAGHSNGGVIAVGGGNGGGIIFIRATNIFANGYKISANGAVGGGSVSDGASGGGGGGSVIMSVTNYSGAENIEVKGGNGGNSDNNGNAGRCYGAGGGGSGGVIYFSGTAPAITITTTGGAAGNETERDGACIAAVLPAAGTNGSYIENYSYTRSFDPGSYCTAPLPVQIGSFTATVVQQKVKLQWTVFNPEEVIVFEIEKLNSNNQWESIAVISPVSNTEDYFTWNNKPLQGKNLYRLKIVESNNKISFSVIKQVDFDFYTKEFNIYPNPASRQMTVTGSFNSPALLQVFDYSGKFVFEKIIFNNYSVINLSALSSGIYLVRINENTKKLVVY
jgi:hypothetical protein